MLAPPDAAPAQVDAWSLVTVQLRTLAVSLVNGVHTTVRPDRPRAQNAQKVTIPVAKAIRIVCLAGQVKVKAIENP